MPSASDLPSAPAIAAVRGAADQLVADPERLGAARIGVGDAVHFHGDEFPLVARRMRIHQRVAAEELALVRMHEAVEAGLVGGVFDRQLAPDQPVGFFHRHRHHGADAERLDAELLAGVHDQIEDRVLHLDRVMQLPAELADEVDAKRMRLARGRR